MKTYSELLKLRTLEERYEYLKLNGRIGEMTFGFDRYLNQILYHDDLWKSARRKAILRDSNSDDVWDLGVEGIPIIGTVYVHHINPIHKINIVNRDPILFDLENLICCSQKTHNAIHYGDRSLLPKELVERTEFDTCPWKKKETIYERN